MTPPFAIHLSITGIQQAQARNQRMIAALQPSGAVGRAVQYGTVAAQRYAISITHVGRYKVGAGGTWVGGGTLRASHRMELSRAQGRVFIDPTSVNPRTGARAAVYGPIEHARGGTHAFYERVSAERGAQIVRAMRAILKAGI
jgi:hypothetical protein